MGVFTHEMEVTSPIPPEKAFKVFVLDYDTLFPKVVPHAIKSVEVLQGDGGPGTIKKINFAEGMGIKYVKHQVHVLDKDNRYYNFSVIEGDVLSEKLEKISDENKFDPAPNGGTIVKITTKFHTVGDAEFKEDEIKQVIQSRARVFKAVEDYVVANPDA
ncbi:MLP-like protein 423 [Hibiscus trionum]|uniref:MLP-like protein 423 n=1 Tax=Hibiscus trionum TaxID=183268 RepID=A0A9W7MJK0_HIBTR|nr:MLP-like protein 423 [Hibiscus trionum]GMJ02095.1 MLP-like protein 423 [Hibiscus trionum]